jgi:hypothetical protein
MGKIKYFFKKYRYWLILLALSSILTEILFLKLSSNLVILFLSFYWILVAKFNKLKGKRSIEIALGLLILCPCFLILKKDAFAEKAAIWFYVFLVIGAVQMVIEYFKDEKD